MEIKYSNYNRPDERVRQLQFQLNNLSESHSLNWERLKEDGIYGKRTAAIIKKFVNWNRQMSLATDGQGLPVLTDALFTEVKKAYDKRPVASMGQPILKRSVPIATPADPAAYKRMIEAGPSMTYDGNTSIIPAPFDKMCDLVKGFVESLMEELQLVRDLNDWKAERILKWYRDQAEPTANKLKATFNRLTSNKKIQNIGDSLPQSMGTNNTLLWNSEPYRQNVKNAYSIGARFDKWLKEANIGKRVENFMNGKGGKFVKGPLKKIWDFKDIIGDLCILAYLLVTGEPVDNLWWSRFEKNLYAFVDELIAGLLGTLVVAGLVAVGVLAGPATLVAGLIGVVVALVFGLICDGFEFSPTKFFMDMIGKSILHKMGELAAVAVDANAKVLGLQANEPLKISRPILYR